MDKDIRANLWPLLQAHWKRSVVRIDRDVANRLGNICWVEGRSRQEAMAAICKAAEPVSDMENLVNCGIWVGGQKSLDYDTRRVLGEWRKNNDYDTCDLFEDMY
ncbi:MAG: hypothetical protein R3E13_02670 [Alphaproteobacteria bacterium]